MRRFYFRYHTFMSIIQRNKQTYQTNSVFKDKSRFPLKWSFLSLCFWLQWLQLQWKNVLANIFLSRSKRVCISYCLEYNAMIDTSNINKFANICGFNFSFSQNQFQLPRNAAKHLAFRSFVLGFVLLQMLWQDKKRGSPLVQNTKQLSKNAFKHQREGCKVT